MLITFFTTIRIGLSEDEESYANPLITLYYGVNKAEKSVVFCKNVLIPE